MKYPKEYYSAHAWIRKHGNKTGRCKHCNMQYITEWANISKKYNRVQSDWIELCGSCHYKFDIEYRRNLEPTGSISHKARKRLQNYPWFV